MLLRLQNSLASMSALSREQDRTANNLANANTVGYKRDRTFTAALNEFLDAEGAPRSERVATQWADLQGGALEKTGNPFDVAVKGEGFFVVADEATGAERYTRAGQFLLDDTGTLRDPLGRTVQGASGPIEVPAGSKVEITGAGEIRVDGQTAGQLRLVRFEDPLALRRVEGAAFDAGGMVAEDLEAPSVLQGYVERSNVDPIREMTNMIEQFRLFESHQKMIQTTDQVLGAITRELGRF